MMRLQRLDLEFFGHFTGKTLDFGDKSPSGTDFHLIYGPNEAGKTTIMEGFLRLLYGFHHRESYAFKHSRATLKVSGTLQLGETSRAFTRLPSQKNNLVDATGAPVPEAALSGALAGLSLDDYKQLLCLDDETIEKGGEEIANSKGDIGRLLFSAAAGVSDLSDVLDASKARSDALYKKGGSKSEYAQLKRTLDDVNSQIRSKDINVAEYRRRKLLLSDAQQAETEIRRRRRAMMDSLAKLKAQSDALSKLPAIRDLEQDLAPLQHFPEHLDIDSEDLVTLSKERAVLEAEQSRLRFEIQEKTTARDQIDVAQDVPMSLRKLDDLKDLRSRCGHASTDLPRRRLQYNAVLQDMKFSLAKGGFGDVSAPDDYVLDAVQLRDLEKKYQAKQDAATALKAAQDELVNASERAEAAHTAMAETEDPSTGGVNVQAILDQKNAAQTLTDVQKGQEAMRLATRKANEALLHLSVNDKTFDEVPPLPLSADDAARLERAMETAKLAVVTAEKDLIAARETEEKLLSQIRFQETSGSIISDEEARTSRLNRDDLWQTHLGDLSQSTAQVFENALRLDDAKTEARQGQATRLGELRHLKMAHCEAEHATHVKETACKTARLHVGELQDTLDGHLAAIGLTKGMSASSFSDWMRRAEGARDAFRAVSLERTATQETLEAAQNLRAALADALQAPDADLEALVTMARTKAAAKEKAKVARQAAQKSVNAAETDLRKRQDRAAQCAAELTAADSDWGAALGQVPGAADHALQFPQAFETFRELRELSQKLMGLRHQIEAMEADEAMLAKAMQQLAQADTTLQNMAAIEAFDAVSATANAAFDAHAQREKLNDDIKKAQEDLAISDDSRIKIDAQVALIADIFPKSIPTDTIDALRDAVLQGNRAIALRTQIRTSVNDLCAVLDVDSRDAAETLLASLSLSTVQTSIEETTQDLASLETDYTKAIEDRSQAQSHLAAIGGDDDVATLTARRQTLELEMESVARQFLELRLGHMLADGAIRRYRDTHRSAMMRAAEMAFAELTNGAYSGLSSQIDGANETLVAIQASDNAAKEARHMSKGTRFQLYLALRAAAYEQMAANGTVLPFLCDDIFETFDEDRTRSACKLLRRIGQTGQAIYLTHHQHVVDIAQDVCGAEVKIHRI